MGWLREKLSGRRSGKERSGGAAVSPPTRPAADSGTGDLGVCDTCNAPLDRAAAYFLPTRTVVLSEAHWADAITMHKGVWELFLKGDKLLSAFGGFVEQHAAHDTPWAVCERCSEFFLFDRDVARSDALNDRRPTGSGPVDPAGCVLFAALGWERVYGSWPRSVAQPTLADTCDFCQKKMYAGELDAFVSTAALDSYAASGFTDHDRPVRGPRTVGDKVGWLQCQVCLARNLARLHRAS